MDVTSVATIHKLNLKAPVEAGGVRIQRALASDHHLIQQRFIGTVGEQVTEVVVIDRGVWITGNSCLDPAVELKSWFRRLWLLGDLLHFFCFFAIQSCHARWAGRRGGLLSVKWNGKRGSINGQGHKARNHTSVCNFHL